MIESSSEPITSPTNPLNISPPANCSPDLRTSRPSFIAGAVATFISQWSIPDPDVFWGALDNVPEMYKTAPPKSCFRAGMEAVALLTMALPRDSQKYDVRKSAMRLYGAALMAVNEALGDPEQRISDHTFMAVIFICIFEALTKVDDTSRTVVHMRGLMTMVDLRGPRQFNTPIGRRLFLMADFLWVSEFHLGECH